MNTNTTKYLWVTIGILVVTLGYIMFAPKTPVDPLKDVPPLKVTSSLIPVAKTSPTDNDLEVRQVYRAEINGQRYDVPVTTKDAPNGVKGQLTQEFDITPLLKRVAAAEVELTQKNWSNGTGLGVHNGDVYVPIEIEKMTSANTSVAIEIHLSAPKETRSIVTGGEIKWKKKF